MYQADSTIQLQDLLDNPNRFGLPTFQEYCKNPDKFASMGKEEILESVDSSAHLLKQSNLIKRQIYELNGIKCDSLEQVQRICFDEGIDANKLAIKPELEKDLAGQYTIVVRLTSQGFAK